MGYLDLVKQVPRRQPQQVQQAEIHDRGRVIRLYRARQSCLEAGHCLQLTQELDCQLFPLSWRWGWCRERVSTAGSGLLDAQLGDRN